MSKKSKNVRVPGVKFIRTIKNINEYELTQNGLKILHVQKPGTGVITTNILYKVGARDEQVGETGLAHMLEHMLFKPTTHDLKKKIDSGAMHFEREVGVVLNANTWKDRTTYFFSYPSEHIDRALTVEAERMRDLTFTNEEFQPERGNVLSEFDMYFGDPYFALELDLRAAAYMNHPYGHETIGWRSDIENYTVEKLKNFYDTYYWPNNAVLMIVGDIELKEALTKAKQHFEKIPAATQAFPRHTIREATQTGRREVRISRPSTTTLLAVGFKHAGFPSTDWFKTLVVMKLLCGGPESVLQQKLVDTGLAADVSYMLEPTSEENLGVIMVTVAEKGKDTDFENIILTEASKLTASFITSQLQKIVANELRNEAFGRESSLGMIRDMVEYESAGDVGAMFNTAKTLKNMKAGELQKHARELFQPDGLTIGHFGNNA